MKTISVEDVVIFHQKIVQATGGLDGVRDRGVIDSALNRAHQTFGGKDLYITECCWKYNRRRD